MSREHGPAPSTAALFARALKDALESTPLSRVTVADLTRRTGLTRQTFYNHFRDVNDLATWVFTTDVARRILDHASYEQWAPGLVSLMEYMRDHRDRVDAVVGSLGLARLETFLFGQFRRMTRVIVEDQSAGLVLRDVDRDLVIDHVTITVLGHVLHWLARGMQEEPSRLVDSVEFIMHGSVREMLERLAVPGPVSP